MLVTGYNNHNKQIVENEHAMTEGFSSFETPNSKPLRPVEYFTAYFYQKNSSFIYVEPLQVLIENN